MYLDNLHKYFFVSHDAFFMLSLNQAEVNVGTRHSEVSTLWISFETCLCDKCLYFSFCGWEERSDFSKLAKN